MRTNPFAVTSLALLLPSMSMADISPIKPLPPQQVAQDTSGFTSSISLATYPAPPLTPSSGRSAGWRVSFQLPAGSSAWSLGGLALRFAPVAAKPDLATSFEVYEGEGAPGTPLTTRAPSFLGASIPQFNARGDQVRVLLDSPRPFLVPGKTLHLLIVPVGDPTRSSPVVLAAPPQLYLSPAEYVFDDMMRPLWRGTRTVDESVIFFRSQAGQPASASLLNAPRKIERVYSYFTGESYVEGKDWKIALDGKLIALEGSSLKVTDDAELHPAAPAPGVRAFKTNDGRNLVSSEVQWNYQRDLWVTYTHDDDWKGPVPTLAEQELPRTLARLRAHQPVKIVVYGDSISVGACASGEVLLPPYLPPWPNLVADELRQTYRTPVTLVNRSLGGQIAAWGEKNAALLVQPETPDLCIIGFGMNDRGGNVPPDKFLGEITQIMMTVRAGNPQVEFILLSSAHNNPEWGLWQPLNDYRAGMLKMRGTGVAVADLTAIHEELLKRKPFIDMSGNNVNHPNDYLVRWYAQVISALLVPQP